MKWVNTSHGVMVCMGCTLLEGMLSVFLNSAWKQGLPIQAILGELFNSSEGKGLRHCHRIREITFQDNKENWSLVFLFVGYPVAYLQYKRSRQFMAHRKPLVLMQLLKCLDLINSLLFLN